MPGHRIKKWTIFWGDGTPFETVPGGTKSLSHTFIRVGTFMVSATGTDDVGT
jgi:hypothetical protein